jgi:hypothetical protein
MSAVTDWIQAIGTTAALAGLGYQTARQRREDRDRDQDRRHGEAAQARLVVPTVTAASSSHGPLIDATVGVANLSDEPIFMVMMQILAADRSLWVVGSLNPAETREYTAPPGRPVRHHQLRIVFTDSAGRLWERNGTEQPKRLDRRASRPRLRQRRVARKMMSALYLFMPAKRAALQEKWHQEWPQDYWP